MSSKRGSSVSLIVFGVLFVILGIFLFVIQSGVSMVMIIAGLDAAFGIALIFAGVLSGGSSAEKSSDAWNDEDQEDYSKQDELPENMNTRAAAYSEPAYTESYDEPQDSARLAAREGELRIAAKRAAEEAAQAKAVATAAVKEAKQAEAELRQAEEELAMLPPAEQRSAMRRIDSLAQRAAEKSEVAVAESRRAKQLIKEARDAAELHSRAMDAAADAMSGEDEFAEFN